MDKHEQRKWVKEFKHSFLKPGGIVRDVDLIKLVNILAEAGIVDKKTLTFAECHSANFSKWCDTWLELDAMAERKGLPIDTLERECYRAEGIASVLAAIEGLTQSAKRLGMEKNIPAYGIVKRVIWELLHENESRARTERSDRRECEHVGKDPSRDLQRNEAVAAAKIREADQRIGASGGQKSVEEPDGEVISIHDYQLAHPGVPLAVHVIQWSNPDDLITAEKTYRTWNVDPGAWHIWAGENCIHARIVFKPLKEV